MTEERNGDPGRPHVLEAWGAAGIRNVPVRPTEAWGAGAAGTAAGAAGAAGLNLQPDLHIRCRLSNFSITSVTSGPRLHTSSWGNKGIYTISYPVCDRCV